jgi:hypothetical protein
MFSPRAMEAWFTLLAEGMKGTAEAQEAFKSLGEAGSNVDLLRQWQARFMPLAGAAPTAEGFEEGLEEWWKMMGVVPRARYLELLERHELLRQRLEKAEETIQGLRATLGGTGSEQEAQKIVDLWDTMLKESLKTQADWMRTWTAAPDEKTEGSKDEP